jgi:hypothetical protein
LGQAFEQCELGGWEMAVRPANRCIGIQCHKLLSFEAGIPALSRRDTERFAIRRMNALRLW